MMKKLCRLNIFNRSIGDKDVYGDKCFIKQLSIRCFLLGVFIETLERERVRFIEISFRFWF